MASLITKGTWRFWNFYLPKFKQFDRKTLYLKQFSNIFYLIQSKSYDYSKLNIFCNNTKKFTHSKTYNFWTEGSFDSIFQHVVEKNFIYKKKCLTYDQG